jgi:Flp pilus assembly pilin Flp
MWNKLFMLPMLACVSVKEFVIKLQSDERGLSGVVVAILLILVAVLAIALIWGFLSGWIQELWAQITGAAAGIA